MKTFFRRQVITQASLALGGFRMPWGSAHGDDLPIQHPVLLSHYMPWFEAKPSSPHWGWHWTMGRIDPDKTQDGEREIAAHINPVIGPYDSGDVHVIDYHLLTMKLAGIDGVIVDWYGLSQFRDYPILHTNTTKVLQAAERLGMKFVICYEDQTIPALVEAQRIITSDRVKHASEEISWLSKYWFQSPSYFKLEGCPVVLSFGHNGLSDDEWTTCLRATETQVVYFSQQMKRTSASGGFDWPVPAEGNTAIERFARESKAWKYSIPVVYPRFVDFYEQAGVSKSYGRIEDDDGNRYRLLLRNAMESKAPIIQIATWNDWGEGTCIEPSVQYGYRDLETTLTIIKQQFPSKTSATPRDLRLAFKWLKRLQQDPNPSQRKSLELAARGLADNRLEEARVLLD